MQARQSPAHRKFERLRYLYRHGGAGGILFFLLYALVNRVTRLRVFRPVILEASRPMQAQLERLTEYRHGLYSPAELSRFTGDPESELTQDFLDYAEAQGDSCYAVIDDDTLVSYCWHSDKPTVIERDLHIEFQRGYIYRYKEFTRHSHRGRRLSSFARAEALRHFAGTGVKGYAGYVEADNFISYRALQRTGHLFPGYIVVLGNGARPWIWHSPKARDWGFRVVSNSDVAGLLVQGEVKSTL